MDYLQSVYNENNKPRTGYPGLMTAHLAGRLGLAAGDTLLEIGCGRAEFLAGFARAGLLVSGVDMCPSALDHAEGLDIRLCALGREPLPFADGTFDAVFSKSLLEHLPVPDDYMLEALRVLKPGGLLVTMTPDWESCHQTFYDDLTHVKPYTVISLRRLYEIHGLKAATVEKFIQLPVVWRHPALKHICRLIAPFVPVRTQLKFPRWSRELMLLAIGRK